MIVSGLASVKVNSPFTTIVDFDISISDDSGDDDCPCFFFISFRLSHAKLFWFIKFSLLPGLFNISGSPGLSGGTFLSF